MPKELDERLLREAEAKFPGDPKQQQAYIAGAKKRLGWRKVAESK